MNPSFAMLAMPRIAHTQQACVAVVASLVLLLLVGCGSADTAGIDTGQPTNSERHLSAPYVVLISFDGFRWDYQDKFETPNFDRVAAGGVRAEHMIPVFPTKTFPTHYTIATGMYAENHRLVGNNFWAPDKQAAYSIGNRTVVEDGTWYGGEPIWVTAERQGMIAASYFFVGSEADVGGVRPSYWHVYDEGIDNNHRVDAVLDWLRLPEEARPHMITLYFSDTDGAGHRYGPDAPETAEAVAKVDGNLGRLLDGLQTIPHGDQVYVVLVSDHGMLRAEADKIDVLDLALYPGLRLAASGPYASLFVDEGGPGRAAAVRDSIAATMPENGVYLREDVPARFHYSADPRIGDIVIVAAPGRTIETPDRVGTEDYFTHGWDNTLVEMGAIFLASGPRIRSGQRIAPFESVNVYPLLAEILGLSPNPDVDGQLDVLRPVLGN